MFGFRKNKKEKGEAGKGAAQPVTKAKDSKIVFKHDRNEAEIPSKETFIKDMAAKLEKNEEIPAEVYTAHNVKRGLRNANGTGVVVGLTKIGEVLGYTTNEKKEKIPCEGKLYYRGYDIEDLVSSCIKENRFGFEEVTYLLLFGELPTQKQFDDFKELLGEKRELPYGFARDSILTATSRNIMNKLARSVLTLYSYDKNPDDTSIENVVRQSIDLIGYFPAIIAYAYQAQQSFFFNQSLHLHYPVAELSTAENILRMIRPNREYTDIEAKLLDVCLILHAEHGGGNNSTFTTRVLSSAQTDIYSTIAAAIGSLKGFRHGGANHKVRQMMTDIMQNVQHWDSDDEVENYLERILRREVGDKSGLIYGIGHAIYTLSDPRAVELKKQARSLAAKTGYADQFALYERIERLAPDAFHKVTGNEKVVCANVDFYSGLVYEMLGIPEDLYTPMFAVSRISGWCAHRIEELTTGGRIIRPAYRALPTGQTYIPLKDRHYDAKSVL